jgi:hypothetical protein
MPVICPLVAAPSDQECAIDGCENPARRSRLCWAHAKRKTRGVVVDSVLAQRYESAWDRLAEAALTYADAGDDDLSFRRAKDRLRKAALDYVGEESAPVVPSLQAMARVTGFVRARRTDLAARQLALF